MQQLERRVPLFFGPPKRQLYGCLHGPATDAARSCAVVLCYPFGTEYIRSHRAFVQLAARLAAQGFAVLRFDYYGTGDSTGTGAEAKLEHWLEDIGVAVGEVRARSGADEVALVGLRLGALLAAAYGSHAGGVASLVLWDPVSSGREYLAELSAQQRALLRHAYLSPGGNAAGHDPLDEVLGFPLPARLRADLDALDPTRFPPRFAERLLVVGTEQPEPGDLERTAARLAPRFERVRLPERRVWLAEASKGLVPHRLLDTIVNWLAREQR